MTASDGSASAPRACRRVKANKHGVEYVTCDDYQSMNYHHSPSGTRHPKSIWLLSRADECHTFCKARLGDWADERGNYWAVAKDGEEQDYGTRRERMAFFPVPSNAADPWHGFPVGGKDGLPFDHEPPDLLVQRWEDEKRIKYTTAARIRRGVL
jgi:hypothetical protein